MDALEWIDRWMHQNGQIDGLELMDRWIRMDGQMDKLGWTNRLGFIDQDGWVSMDRLRQTDGLGWIDIWMGQDRQARISRLE